MTYYHSEEGMKNCQTFDEYIKDCWDDICYDFEQSTGESVETEGRQAVIDYAREWWTEATDN